MNNPLGWYSKSIYKKWIRKHNLRFKEIYYCSEKTVCTDKLNGCRKFNVEIMIEDKPDVAVYLAEKGIQVLLFDAPYNRSISNTNIIRVYSWENIYNYLENT